MVVRRVHQHADLGLKIRRMQVQSMMLLLHVDASLNTGGLVGSQGGYICGVADQSLLEGRSGSWSPLAWRSFKMSRTFSDLVGCRSTSHVYGFGLCRVGNTVSAGIGSWTIRSTGCSSGHAGETSSVCVTDCKSLYDHLSAASTLQDKRSAIDVLIIRESLKKTGLCDTFGTNWAALGGWPHKR